jgi:putative thioredoxin
MSKSAHVLEATKANFPELVIGNSGEGTVLVDFWASFAGPSPRQRELLLRLVRAYGGRLLLVNTHTEREKEVAREVGVKRLRQSLFGH